MFEVLPANKQDLVAAYNFDRRELQSVGSAAGDSGKVESPKDACITLPRIAILELERVCPNDMSNFANNV